MAIALNVIIIYSMKTFKLSKLELGKHYCKKTSFPDEKTANYYLDKIKKSSRRSKVPVYSYLCSKCFAWHLTSWEQPDIIKMFEELNQFVDECNEWIDTEIEAFKTGVNLMKDTSCENYNLKKEIRDLKKKIASLEDEIKKNEILMRYRL